MKLYIHTDGGSRGNPGHSGCGVVIYDHTHTLIYQQSHYLGVKTNNEAEYIGLTYALNWLSQNYIGKSIDQVYIYMDSQLIIRQIQGLYKVKSVNLQPLFAKARNIIDQLPFPITFVHILRDKNKLADQLANLAMDKGAN